MSRKGGTKNASSSRNASGVAVDMDPSLREMANECNPMMDAMFRLMEQQSKLIHNMVGGRGGTQGNVPIVRQRSERDQGAMVNLE